MNEKTITKCDFDDCVREAYVTGVSNLANPTGPLRPGEALCACHYRHRRKASRGEVMHGAYLSPLVDRAVKARAAEAGVPEWVALEQLVVGGIR